MFSPDWLILRILRLSFEIERPKGHKSDVVVYLYRIDISKIADSIGRV